MSARRHLRSILAIAAVFGAGWAAGRLGGSRGVAHAEPS
ncbi:MAG: hypothetical protein K0S65_5801, partial [Labilithrix sp.]|nr:hypothetical protein [Labilithrix sp.]